ncbi:Von Willebrand factor type A domain-containing protein [Rhizobium phage RHph_I46]|uniref:von Willebrand factor type A domain-containing protein n=1 Tax=Rhizobium phage RHph_I1_9 TaxID=2509729 RepID=A0A7S5UYL5_9CAUD|nr:Von Willebrand factor type A domain-containing protein [Rhizobium phage RHph_I1_9]QIG69790.1 Von Willebrand factor type A domain-containing protein [Rhizobium phage RHph_I46]QIG71071.1 Von Willebrand factor type A domain-containing protein [Rhizobium phage RHph_I9]QIG73656.1 Von Willebrand factor type A domain-containing protein [Rhizobium phage RHph_I1_9]QIG76410.1 Von Willebrand factor type A domain-containing protein [Rhizobium phage RHph_I34]
MKSSKFKVTVGGKSLTVTAIDPSTPESTETPKTHHILLLDRSGSMYTSINELIDQAKDAVATVHGSNDLISILWFSGQGSNGVIVEAADRSTDIVSKLDQYRSVLGATCFSEPLEKAATIARSHSSKVDQTTITLFTDGCPVVNWSYDQELSRSIHSLVTLYDVNLTAVNSIGYGNYYRRDFLQQLSDTTQFGTFTHSRDIDEFSILFEDVVGTARGLRPSSISVDSVDSEIIYLGGDTRTYRRYDIDLTRLNKETNRIFVVSENDVFINGEMFETKTITQKEDPKAVEDFFYAYADALYYRGERQKALDIVVNNLKDKAIADTMINAFTLDEVATAQMKLRDADLFVEGRYKEGKCAPGYLPKKDAFCLIDLFKLFFEDGRVSYVPFSENVKSYERINRKSEDKYNVFKADQEEVVTPVRDFVWNKDLLNLSIQFSINGVVELNPKAAKNVGLDPEFKTKIFRNHTIVKDGQLNMDKAEFIVPLEVVNKFKNEKIKYKVISQYHDEDYENDLLRVVFELKSIPIINRLYIDNSVNLDELCGYTIEIAKHEAELKVLNSIFDKVVDSNARFSKTDAFKTYTAEQIAVLEEHGISKQGWYNGVQVERAKAEDSDSYEARTLSFYVKGASSLPTNADFEKMLTGKKEPNVPGKMMIQAYNLLEVDAENEGLNLGKPTVKLVEFLDSKIKNTKKTLQTLRNEVNVIKLAKVLTNDFFHGLVPNDKGEYTVGYDDHTVVLRNAMKTVYI